MSDDSFAEIYELEKKAASLLAKGDDGWLQVNRDIMELQEYWSADEYRDYASYKTQRQQDERAKGKWKAVKRALNETRAEYAKIVKDVMDVDLENAGNIKPKKKSRKNTAVAQNKSAKSAGKKKAQQNKQVAQARGITRNAYDGR